MLLCWIFFSLLLRAGIQQILSTNLSFLLLYLSWGPTYWFHSARYTCRRIERMAGCCSDSRDTLCCRIIPWQEMHDQSFGSDGTKQIFQGDLSYRLSFSSLLLNYCCLKSMLLSKVHLIHFSCWLQAIVTDEDDMESIANRFLSADMDLQKQIIEKSPPKRRLTVDTIFWWIYFLFGVCLLFLSSQPPSTLCVGIVYKIVLMLGDLLCPSLWMQCSSSIKVPWRRLLPQCCCWCKLILL